MATDEAFRRRVDALPSAEQLAEIVLEAERRGAMEGQAGVIHLTIFREERPPVRLYLMTNRVWWQVRTPRPIRQRRSSSSGNVGANEERGRSE